MEPAEVVAIAITITRAAMDIYHTQGKPLSPEQWENLAKEFSLNDDLAAQAEAKRRAAGGTEG